jgi:type IV pilus assembly protein PilC
MNTSISLPFFQHVSHQDRLLFTKHLSIMLKSGIPIAEAFDIIQAQTKTPAFAKILQSVSQDIQNGQTLSKTFSKHTEAFDHLFISMIEIGEESGTLEQTFVFLSEQLTKQYALKQKIRGALMYPGLVVTAASIMGGFISLFILPQLVSFFDSFDSDLPITTEILLIFATTMKQHGVYIISGIGILLFALSMITRHPKVKPYWHYLLLKLPIIGTLITYSNLAYFSRNLGILIKSGVPIARSLEITEKSFSNIVFKRAIARVHTSLAKGISINNALSNKSNIIFPQMVCKMVAVGEKTGKLDETLLYLGDFYEDEIDVLSKNLSSTLEPILLLVIGLGVGFIALAIISPIYELTGSIR